MPYPGSNGPIVCNAVVSATKLNGSSLGTGRSMTPSISSNYNSQNNQYSNGIVWVIQNNDDPPGNVTGTTLYALDAGTLKELYDSNICSSDKMSAATRFSVPTIANGYVYAGSQYGGNPPTASGYFYIFGQVNRPNGC